MEKLHPVFHVHVCLYVETVKNTCLFNCTLTEHCLPPIWHLSTCVKVDKNSPAICSHQGLSQAGFSLWLFHMETFLCHAKFWPLQREKEGKGLKK